VTARGSTDPGQELEDTGGALVQLSVRLSPDLRRAVAEVAAARGRSVTAFVIEVLDEAVRVHRDPFAGLAADMVANLRAELGRALESGAYTEGSGLVRP
jgi:hypothetical protein